MEGEQINNESQNVEVSENVEIPQQASQQRESQNTAAKYTEKMRKQALEKLAAMQKTMLKMNPDIMFKPVSIILLVGIIVIYWLFFGMVYQNEYFKNASIFWVMIITFSFLIFSK